MTSTYFKFYILFSLFTLINITSLFSQDVIMTPKSFIFSWQKASGDKYEIPVKNNLEVEIEQQKINRVLNRFLIDFILILTASWAPFGRQNQLKRGGP